MTIIITTTIAIETMLKKMMKIPNLKIKLKNLKTFLKDVTFPIGQKKFQKIFQHIMILKF